MRDDIHTVEDLIRVIREEVPQTENIISTPLTSTATGGGENPIAGQTETDMARRLILAGITPEAGWDHSDKNRLDFIVKAERTEFNRLKSAATAAERANRFR